MADVAPEKRDTRGERAEDYDSEYVEICSRMTRSLIPF